MRLLAFFLTLYFTTYLSWPDWLYFYCFFSFEYFDSFDHYAAGYVHSTSLLYFSDQALSFNPIILYTLSHFANKICLNNTLINFQLACNKQL